MKRRVIVILAAAMVGDFPAPAQKALPVGSEISSSRIFNKFRSSLRSVNC